MKIRKYLALTKAGIIQELHFRLGTFVTIFGNLIYLILVYFLWKAIYASSPADTVNGMTFTDTIIYLVLATALFNFLEMFIVWDMSRSIQSGEIILDLLKPVNYRRYKFFSYFGDNVVTFFLTFLPTFVVVYLITHGAIRLGLNLLFFVVSVALALLVNFHIELLVATICLYTESTWGINIVKESIVLMLSGATIPLAFFPEKLRTVVEYMPFRCIYDTPLNILLEKDGYTMGTGVFTMLAIQVVWCVILVLASKAFWNFSVRRITVNGG
ncbi:MAG: ABC-2 family transporter protein [Lachnospiraceae bacterium]|nr:ABC-2 family transporter protein [Lachnospiraceae bacterium]